MRTWLVIVSAFLVPTLGAAPSPAQQEEPEPQSGWWDEAKALYEKAKEAGETGSDNVTDWVVEDFQRMASWEYKVVRLGETSDDTLEEQLNSLGEERWECFEVVVDKRGTALFLKRPAKSYLRAVPISDLLKLLPRGEGSE